MKIAVQGTFIDTESIYSIGEIYKDYNDDRQPIYCFDILHFGGETKTVSIRQLNVKKDREFAQFKLERSKLRVVENETKYTEEDKIEFKKLYDITYSVNKDSLEKMRLDIVKIWSENQTTVPSFNVENY